MGSFAFWVESIFFPLISLTINAVVRWRARMPQSAPADLILLLWVFDVAVILKADTFSQFSELLANPNDLRAWFVIVLLVNVGLWMAIFRIEYMLARGTASRTGWFTQSRPRAMILCFATSTVAVVTSTAAFTMG